MKVSWGHHSSGALGAAVAGGHVGVALAALLTVAVGSRRDAFAAGAARRAYSHANPVPRMQFASLLT